MMTASTDTLPAERPAHWGGVLAMSLCVFALVASEFMPISLLTPVARDLGVSEGLAGQGIALSGALAVLTSLALPVLAGGLNRKTLLLGMTALMAISGAVIAFANGYASYLLGRALIGVAIGGFWSMSAATAMRLVPAAQVPRALAVFNGGSALATIIAAPLGSYLGALVGWRGAFLCLVPVALVALVWQGARLPTLPAAQPAGGRGVLWRLLRRPVVALGLAGCGLFFMGQLTLFTYLRPFLEGVNHASARTLSLTLLAIGLAGFAGTTLIGALLRRGLFRTLVAIPLLLAAIALLLVLCAGQLALVVPLLGLWGLAATAAPVGWWAWVARTLPEEAEAGGGLMVAVIQLSIALGSTAGGVLFDVGGYASTFIASALLLLLAALMTAYAARRAA
ncbi:MFS transporter [Nissabacter sp. SGAir0207]|uniref:MFS transporter n=1 Tax=Nissabacter sp. SGAir0207 TaxID=2126321 RepID=UPI001F101507|nr:MFS transporter [Nissabacter sp. SGAir0207]